MSNPNVWRLCWAYITLASLLLMLLSQPVEAEFPSKELVNSHDSLANILKVSAIPTSETDTTAPMEEWTKKGKPPRRLDEAKAVLEELRSFADTAQQAIWMGRRIKMLRLENKRFRQAIADYEKGNHDFERHLIEIEGETSSFTKTVVANWITTLRLKDEDRSRPTRLKLARDALTKSEERLASLNKQIDERFRMIHNLRVKSDTLAAEIARIERQIVISDQGMRRIADNSHAIEMAIRELRHTLSSRLRALLVEN